MILNILLALLPVVSVKAECPPGTIYESLFSKCYKYINQPLGFLSAEENCQTIGGHLVSVSNAFENAYVSGIAAQGGAPAKYWIGANLLSASSWTWTSNQPFVFSNWATGEPSDPSMKQCGSVRDADNLWTKEICYSALPSVCSIDPNAPRQPMCSSTTSSPSTSCENAVCSEGYNLFPKTCRCYKYYDDVVFYSEAEKQCANNNATLAKISSAELNDFLFSLFSVDRTHQPWIGLKCPSSNLSSCYWPDGSNALGYSNFMPGNPNGQLTTFMSYESNGQWESYSLDFSPSAYLCEKDSQNVRQILQQTRNFRGASTPLKPIK